jgi:hypothetical protein
MSLSRLRAGELLALAGSIALFALMFGTWAAPEGSLLKSPAAELPPGADSAANSAVSGYVSSAAESGWSSLGWFLVAMLVVMMLAGLLLAVLTVTERDTPVLAVATFVLASGFGIITSVVLLIRLTLAQPALAYGFPDSQVDVRGIAWLGLLALITITAGAWIAMGDERTDAATSTVPEIPVRPAPPAAA